MVVDAAEQRAAGRTIDYFVQRAPPADCPAYRRLLQYASLPLVLTPELLNFLRTTFAREAPWVAEVDILLSDELCDVKGFEQYVLKTSIRAWLLSEARAHLPEAQIKAAMALLLHYLYRVVGSSIPPGEFTTQAWGAMLYLDDHRDDAVREIVGALHKAVAETMPSAWTGATDGRAELERLVELVQTLAAELEQFPTLLDLARLTSQVLRGEIDRATISDDTLWRATTVAGVQLPTLASLIAPGSTPVDGPSGPEYGPRPSGKIAPRSSAAQTTSEASPTGFPESDPFEALILSDGKPFIDRAELRWALRSLELASAYGPRILVIDGPPGSGKSYSVFLIRHVARALGHAVVLVRVRDLLPDRLQPVNIVRAIALQLGLDVALIPASGSEVSSSPRFTYELTRWLVHQATTIDHIGWLIFDDVDAPFLTPDVGDFIAELARVIDDAKPSLRLVLIGGGVVLPVEVERFALREQIAPLDALAVREFFEHLARERQVDLSPQQIDEIVSLIFEQRSADDVENMRTVSNRLRDVIDRFFNERGMP